MIRKLRVGVALLFALGAAFCAWQTWIAMGVPTDTIALRDDAPAQMTFIAKSGSVLLWGAVGYGCTKLAHRVRP